MFDERALSPPLERARERHAPEALVLDCASDFDTLPPEALDDLALVTDSISPASYPDEWLPDSAPEILQRYAGSDLVIGTPGAGSVAWTTQTAPPICFVKARVEGVPEAFVEFLIAEALVEVGLDLPEQFIGFFGERYPDLDHVLPFEANGTYRMASALYAGWRGLHTREVFAEWADDEPALHASWSDAGRRLEPRLSELPAVVASDELDFLEATELACGAIKHDLELPAPFGALDTYAYREHGPEFAIRWAERTFEELLE